MTGKGKVKNERKDAAASVLISAGIGLGVCILLAFISSAFLLFAPEPSVFYLPAGLASLYVGAAVSGCITAKRIGAPAAAFFSGSLIAALAATAGAFVRGSSERPVLLTVALFLLVPAASFLAALNGSDNGGFVATDVTVDIDGDRKACDMRRSVLDENAEASDRAAETLRPDTERIDRVLYTFLERRVSGVRRRSFSEKSPLRQKRRDLEISSDTHADPDRRTRVGARARD